jgi:hypothetical protein
MSHLLIATTTQDHMFHVARVGIREVYLTLCGQDVLGLRALQPVPDDLACPACAGELGPHDHIPLVSDGEE